MAAKKIEINRFYYNCGFLGCQLALAERDPYHMVRARRVPRVTRTGRRVHWQRRQAVARELVSCLVEFAVDVAYGPGAACLGEVLTQVVAFSEQIPKVAPMAAPSAGHLHRQ